MKLRLRSVESTLLKMAWRFLHPSTESAVPVFIFGVQRSGTTMLGNCLGNSPEVRLYAEHDKRAFDNFALRGEETIDQLLAKCAQKYAVFKPLTVSHKASGLIQRYRSSKAIWMYRRYENMSYSSVKKFGEHNLLLMRQFAKRKNLESWQAQGLDEQDLELISSFDLVKMSPQGGAALFWYLRNNLFIKQKLYEYSKVRLVSYESLVSNPSKVVSDLCSFIGCRYSRRLIRDIHQESLGVRPVEGVCERLQELCANMYENLEGYRKGETVLGMTVAGKG